MEIYLKRLVCAHRSFLVGLRHQKNHSFTMKEWLCYSLYFYDFQVFST